MTCDYCGHPLTEDLTDRPTDAPYDERQMVCITAEDDDNDPHTRGWFKLDLI